jgi:hypothetical protein
VLLERHDRAPLAGEGGGGEARRGSAGDVGAEEGVHYVLESERGRGVGGL